MSRLKWISFLAVLILCFIACPAYAQAGVEVLQTSLFDAQWPELSGDGRFMVFEARASQNGDVRIFVQEIVTGEVTDLLEGIDLETGAYRPDISDDGRYVVFYSKTNKLVEAELPQTPNCITNSPNCQNIYLVDRDSNQDGEYTEDVVIILASPNLEGNYGNGHSNIPKINGSGTTILYQSQATDLIAEDANGKARDLFIFEVAKATVSVESVSDTGTQISQHGYLSNQYDISNNGTVVFAAADTGWSMIGDNNKNCRRQGFLVDCYDVFVRDSGTTELVSKSNGGSAGNENSYHPFISGNSQFIFFWSKASNLVKDDQNSGFDVHRYDRNSRVFDIVNLSDDNIHLESNALPTSYSEIRSTHDGDVVLFGSTGDLSEEVVGAQNTPHFYFRSISKRKTVLFDKNGQDQPSNATVNVAGISLANTGLAVFSSRATNLGEYENLPTIYGNSIGSYLYPVLDLPIQVTDGNHAAALHSRYPNGLGRVNSWFDHTLPNYVENGLMTPWTGVGYRNGLNVASCNRASCYDGHDGIDFSRESYTEDLDEPILAAADGEIVRTVDSCIVGDTSCGGGLGNQIWIDHGFGYATVYAHLRSIYVSEGQEVQAGDQIGVMGNTGRSGGKHLHFGLHYHPNNLWQQTQTVLDPYGWQGSFEDPWTTTSRKKSEYVWRNHLETTGVSRSTEPLVSEDGRVTLRSSTALTVSLQLMPVQFQISEFLNSLGLPALWLHYPGNQLQASGSESALIEYIINDQEAQHFDLPSVVVYRSDSIDSMPITVDSELTEGGVLFAAVEGIYSLHAPLLCAGDIEPDDQFDFARTVQVGDHIGFFDSSSDVDWFTLTLELGKEYIFELSGKATLQLFDQDGTTVLSDSVNMFSWVAASQSVYVKVVPSLQTDVCEQYFLNAALVGEEATDMIYLPVVMR